MTFSGDNALCAWGFSLCVALAPLACGSDGNPSDKDGGVSGAGGASGSMTTGSGTGGSAGAGAAGGATGKGGAAGTAGAGGVGGSSDSGGGTFDSGADISSDASNRGNDGGLDASRDNGPDDRAGSGGAGGGAGAGGASGSAGASGAAGNADGGGSTPGTLRDAAERTARLCGAAIAAQRLSETAYANAAKEFNYATPENEMKWDATEPARDQFQFTNADAIVDFALQNAMKVKGHTLVWHSQLPAWASALTNASDVRAAMVNHIQKVVAHFSGKVAAWDVVNEAWNDNGASMRDSVFHQYLGDGFIDEAFQAARAADPSAKLYYNDYSAEGNSTKANAVYSMVESMKMRGIPIDGVGLQMHVGPSNSGPSTAQFVANMQRIAALGLEVLISEMDVDICSSDVNTQRTRFHDIVAACVAEPRCQAITFWGVTDKYSWLNGRNCASAHGLLFDDNYAKKPAYSGVLDALLGR